MSPPRGAPRATYRLQLSHDFTFRDATALVDYLSELGVSHLYASPFLQARPGSTHGYDITDHNQLNPEIGSPEDFAALVRRLHAHGMGLILDFVPNHMGVGGSDNHWWLDVLEWGQDSPYAAFFDIDWDAGRRDLKGKLLLPLLGDQYGAVLERGEIVLRFDAEEGSFSAWYFEHRLPIAPASYGTILSQIPGNAPGAAEVATLRPLLAPAETAACRGGMRARGGELKRQLRALAAARPPFCAALAEALAGYSAPAGQARGWQRLHRLLETQFYRLAYWRVAADEVNYRRFFNINELAGLRVELPEAFAAVHRLVLSLVADGSLQGLRVDHVDGLFDARAYCRRLRGETDSRSAPGSGPFYIVVEKILARYEALRDWPVAGTTGYEFANQLTGLFIDPEAEQRFIRLYASVTGRYDRFDDILHASKLRIATVNLASEVNALAEAFHAFALADRRTRDFTATGMRNALCEILAAFPVYRTYVDGNGASPEDRRFIDWAIAVAKRRSPAVDTSIFDFIGALLSGSLEGRTVAGGEEARRLAMRFQQVSAPVMAKGLEDTSFYRHFPLLALNEVGGDPRRFGVSTAAFHHFNQERARDWPQAMLTTATHDTKRGEDARMRLAVLSEMPQEWRRRVQLWLRLNRLKRGEIEQRPAPVRNDEYFFYQTLVGAWPFDLDLADSGAVAAFAERIAATMVKAIREGKEQSSWGNPNAAYEAALQRFVASALDASRPNPFLADLATFVSRIARLGAVNSLAQVALKLTSPGVPDIYQGAELWDLSLVDPDNRRAVDFAARRRQLAELRATPDSRPDRSAWRDGREKLFLLWRLLALRAEHPALFTSRDYTPLAATGSGAAHVCAFLRRHDGVAVAVIVPRLVARLYGTDGAAQWGDTELPLPSGAWRDAVAGQSWTGGVSLPLARLLEQFPVAVLVAGPAQPVSIGSAGSFAHSPIDPS